MSSRKGDRVVARTRVRVRWLRNHGLTVTRRPPGGGILAHYVPPDGRVAVEEAAAALGTNEMKLYRLAALGLVRLTPSPEGRRVKMSELRRLKKLGSGLLADRRRHRAAV